MFASHIEKLLSDSVKRAVHISRWRLSSPSKTREHLDTVAAYFLVAKEIFWSGNACGEISLLPRILWADIVYSMASD